MRTLALLFSVPLILFGVTPPARSASVTLLSDPRDVVLVNGVIETADIAKIDGILSSLKGTQKGTPTLWINSDGGDLAAAIAIGRLLRKAEALVTVQGRCASACIFILAGGVTRSAMQGVVVIHRPFLTEDLPGGTGYDESYKRAAQMIRSYLAEMNIPAELGERMLTIPPDAGVTLTKEELDRYTLLIAQDPAYEQKLAASEAHRWGISLTEQRRRQSIQKTICVVNTPKHKDDDVEFGVNWYCNDAVMSGEDPSGIQTRLTWVMANRSAIARMPDKAQWECIKELIFGSSKDCFNHPLEFTHAPAPTSQADVEQGAQALDAQFQKMPMWIVVKREFPAWYSEQLKQAATLFAQKQPQVAVNKHLAEALVALRRQHAQEALLARTDKLKAVASAFLDNLRSLSKRGNGACYAFITRGETAPVVLEILQSPDGATVQAQVAATFDAIADGRKTPTQHEKAVKTDYEVLVQELSKLGWKQNDLKVFSDHQALSHEPPERVCQMVQDWFAAHLAVADKATQERLLVETLKPVVSG